MPTYIGHACFNCSSANECKERKWECLMHRSRLKWRKIWKENENSKLHRRACVRCACIKGFENFLHSVELKIPRVALGTRKRNETKKNVILLSFHYYHLSGKHIGIDVIACSDIMRWWSRVYKQQQISCTHTRSHSHGEHHNAQWLTDYTRQTDKMYTYYIVVGICGYNRNETMAQTCRFFFRHLSLSLSSLSASYRSRTEENVLKSTTRDNTKWQNAMFRRCLSLSIALISHLCFSVDNKRPMPRPSPPPSPPPSPSHGTCNNSRTDKMTTTKFNILSYFPLFSFWIFVFFLLFRFSLSVVCASIPHCFVIVLTGWLSVTARNARSFEWVCVHWGCCICT